MSGSDIERVQRDLDTMRQALGHQRLSRVHIWHNLLIAVVGIIMMLATIGTNIAVPYGVPPNLWYVGLILVCGMLVPVSLLGLAKSRAAQEPLFLRESKTAVLAALFAAAAYVAFAFWAVNVGLSMGSMSIASVFACGVFLLVSAFAGGKNPVTTGWGITFLGMAFLLPLGSYENAGLVAGLFLVLGGLLCAVLVERHIRNDHATD